MFITGILVACQTYLENFTAVVPEHHCRLQNQTNVEAPFLGDGRDSDLLKVSIPMDKHGKPETCLRFTELQWQLLNPNATEQTRLVTEDCLDGWVYDKSELSSSIVTEWDLVCGQKSLKSITRTIYVGGFQIGSVAWGILSDRFGRRTVLRWASLLAIIAGTCTAFMPTFAAYATTRFLTGAALSGIYHTRNCLTLEWTPTERRILVNTCNSYAFTFGHMILAGWAYLVRDWRRLQFSISGSFGIVLLFSLALPESACWLITHNKLDAAVKTLQKVAWINGHKEQGRKLTLEGVMSYIQEDLASVTPKSILRNLFQNPGICKITLCIGLAWFAAGFSFYGLILDLQKFGFSIYLVQVLFALIDFPTRFLAAVIMSHCGNRLTFIFCAVFSGCMIITDIFVPRDMAALRLTISVLGKGGIGLLLLCLHLFTLELYPTEVRQKGMSVGGLASSFGAMLAPLVFIIASYSHIVQPLLFGGVPILSAIAVSFLIETHGLPLLQTIQETEKRMKRAQCLKGNAKKDIQERPALLMPEMPQAESTV
ncbi:solute carrier family 22 member 20-like [Dromiciops gliroides]|uniref:solute carrier family 22 member 20-like n=1 Tax=Dromiciops gliroides TaxID=33562 RepID=UPI001CC474D1|nr:solute carrier family 22 member 20-like [Dromiciops gliroides]